MELTPEQGRVLGALVEKERTTPQGYPLTDAALLAACNQTTSRDPVVQYDTATVRLAVRALRELDLVRTVHRTGERSDKHRHELESALGLSPAQVAVLAVLLLRGPQTAAEVRARTERMHPFADAAEVEAALAALGSRDEPLVVRLERQPGRKETRYAQVLTGGAPAAAAPGAPADAPPAAEPDGAAGSSAAGPTGVAALAEQVAALREEVTALRAEVTALRAEVTGLRGAPSVPLPPS